MGSAKTQGRGSKELMPKGTNVEQGDSRTLLTTSPSDLCRGRRALEAVSCSSVKISVVGWSKSDHFDGRRFTNPDGIAGLPFTAVARMLRERRTAWPRHVDVPEAASPA